MVAAMRRLKEEFLRSLEEKDRKIREASERVSEQHEDEESMQTFAQGPMQTFAFKNEIFGAKENTREAQQRGETPGGADPPTLFRDDAVP
jgi:hypothetical protein